MCEALLQDVDAAVRHGAPPAGPLSSLRRTLRQLEQVGGVALPESELVGQWEAVEAPLGPLVVGHLLLHLLDHAARNPPSEFPARAADHARVTDDHHGNWVVITVVDSGEDVAGHVGAKAQRVLI